MLVKSPNGFPVLDPHLLAANRALKKMPALLAEFGMSLDSRSRIQASATDEPDNERAKLIK